MELIIIDEREKYNASVSANAFADKNTRNRVYVNTLGAETVLKYLVSENINISHIHNIHSIKKVLEEIDIADIMLPNIHIDVRVVYDENKIFIPKSHFEYNITPDVYIVIKPAEDYSRAEILGFFEPKLINKNNANKDYYFIENEKLNSAADFIQFIKDFNGNTKHHLSQDEFTKYESIIISFVDHDISNNDKKQLLQQLVKSDDLRNKFIEFENFETLSYKAMTDPSIIKEEFNETQIINSENFEDEQNISEETSDLNLNTFDEPFDFDNSIDDEIEDFEDELDNFETTANENEPVDTDKNINWNLLDGIDNIGEVMAAGAAAITKNAADNTLSDIAENVISDTLETISENIDDNNISEDIPEKHSFDELPEIENLIGNFEHQDEIQEELVEPELSDEENIQEEEILSDVNNIDEIEDAEIQEHEMDFEELPMDESIDEPIEKSDIETSEEKEEPETVEHSSGSFGTSLLENLHAEEEESISIENLGFIEAEPEETPLEPFPEELKNLESVNDLEEIEESAAEEILTMDELPEIETPLDEEITVNEKEEFSELEPLPELSELESLPEVEDLSMNNEEVQENLPELEVLSLNNEEIPEISQETVELPEATEEQAEDKKEEIEPIENLTEENIMNELPEIEALNEEPATFEELEEIEDTVLEENIQPEELIPPKNTEEPAQNEELFSSIDNILPDTIESVESLTEPAESIEDIPDISALTSDIIPEEIKEAEKSVVPQNSALEPVQTSESENVDISDMVFNDNSELEVLYSENEPKITAEIQEEQAIPGAAFLQTKQPLNKKYLVTAALTIILAISAFAFIKNKNNEIAEVSEIPQNTSAETPVDENILEVNTPDITSEVKEVKQVEEIKKPTQEIKQDVKNNIPNSKTPQAYVSVSKLVWDVPDNLSYSKNIQNYLRTAGKSIKLSLSADLLLATEYAYTNQVKVSLKLNKDGNVEDAQIISGSGSSQIDKIVLQSVKDTLNVVKPPVNEISTPNFNLNLIIYF